MEKMYLEPAWKIAKAVKEGEISAKSIAEIFIERISKIDPLIKSWTALDEEYFIKQAEVVDNSKNKGPLAGVPIGIKDIFNTRVLSTKMGSSIWRDHKAGNDARCISYLIRDDGIIAGKTDTAEFAVHASGKALNPYGSSRVAGTSSGGSATAVATAMVPAALGTQTAGSLIRPASWCGTYCMKPSFGLIPRTGVLKTTDTLDNMGFYGRDCNDLKLLFDSLRVRGRNFPISEPKLKAFQEKGSSNFKVAFVRGHLWEEAPRYTQKSMEGLANDLRTLPNIEIVELELPAITHKAHELHRRIYNPCLEYYFREELSNSHDQISEVFLSLVEDGKTISPSDYKLALAEQSTMAFHLQEYFNKNEIDIIIMHSSNGSAPIGNEPGINQDLNLLWTLSWLPVINIPQFFCPEGFPYGFQVVGPRYSDYRLIDFLKQLVQEEIIIDQGPVVESPFKFN